jgi:hypothetical protein
LVRIHACHAWGRGFESRPDRKYCLKPFFTERLFLWMKIKTYSTPQDLTNAAAESFDAKIKAFRSQFRGVRNIEFFLFRLTNIYA